MPYSLCWWLAYLRDANVLTIFLLYRINEYL